MREAQLQVGAAWAQRPREINIQQECELAQSKLGGSGLVTGECLPFFVRAERQAPSGGSVGRWGGKKMERQLRGGTFERALGPLLLRASAHTVSLSEEAAGCERYIADTLELTRKRVLRCALRCSLVAS